MQIKSNLVADTVEPDLNNLNVIAMETKWFTIFTRPGYEMIVSKALTHKNIVNYCPLAKVITKKGRIYSGEVPLFRCYVFVKTYESHLNELRGINGVINFLYLLNNPVVTDDSEIIIIKEFINKHINVNVKKEETWFDTDISAGTNKTLFGGSAQWVRLQSLQCKLVGELAPEIVTPRAPSYAIKFLKIRPQHALKTFFIICIKVLSDI